MSCELILQSLSLHLRHSSVSKPSSLHLRHSSFSNPSASLPTSKLVLQPFRCFTYVAAHSPTLPLLHLRHSSFYNLSAASPTSQLNFQPFRRFTYFTGHFTTLPLLHLRHRYFTYVTWRTAHAQGDEKTGCGGLAFYSKLLSLEVATVLDSC